MESKFELDAVLTVVDAKQILMRLDEWKPPGVTNEAMQQVLFADKILLNKVDLVTPAKLCEVEQRLTQLHPTAPILRCHRGQVPPEELVGLKSFDLERISQLIPDFLQDEFLEFNEKHDKAVTSLACSVDGELDTDLLTNWIDQLTQELGDRLYRYKGVLAVDQCDEKFVFQGVGMMFRGEYNPNMVWNPNEKRVSRFVFIGKDLPKDYLKQGFEYCKAPLHHQERALRFPVGTPVWAKIMGRWEEGTIVEHWLDCNPYRIHLLHRKRDVVAPLDIDTCVKAR